MARPKGFVIGVGINDADYDVDKCPFYVKWRGMLTRCYSASKEKCYEGCSVCKDWLTFSKFKAWMIKQDWQGKEIDKDLIVRGNKAYSPETCCFISNAVNTFIVEHDTSRGNYPLGVKLEKRTGKYTAQVRNPFNKKSEHIGTFLSPEQANLAWKKRKHELACQLADTQTDERVAAALRVRYL